MKDKIYKYTISFLRCAENPVVENILQSKIVPAETAKPELLHDYTFLLTPEQIERALEQKKRVYSEWAEKNGGYRAITKEQAQRYYESDKRAILEHGFGSYKSKLPPGTQVWRHYKKHYKLVYTA